MFFSQFSHDLYEILGLKLSHKNCNLFIYGATYELFILYDFISDFDRVHNSIMKIWHFGYFNDFALPVCAIFFGFQWI